MTKPIVNFDKTWPETKFPKVGFSAYVWGFNHPVLNQTDITTSTVEEVFPDGSFTTLNTLYVPVDDVKRDESKRTRSGYFW